VYSISSCRAYLIQQLQITNFTLKISSVKSVQFTWCSGNTLVSINIVAPHRARRAQLLLGSVTVCWQVNRLNTYPTT